MGRRVPLLAWADLGFHELGHLLTYPFPETLTAVMGSVFQVFVPAGLGAYFLLLRRDMAGSALCLAWAGTAARDVSDYIADAPYEELELIGGEHDWAFLLGPDGFDALEKAQGVSTLVEGFGALLLLAAICLCVWGLVGNRAPPATTRAPLDGDILPRR